MDKRVRRLLAHSYKNQLAHIPSALSMFDYLTAVFGQYIDKDDIIILGKPFGAQAYYIVWKELGWLDDIDSLSMGVKHDEIPFVDYSEETIGNALGVAIGMAIAHPKKKVYVNISDATLQMGNALEAIQFIGRHKLNNILVTVDWNNSQVTGKVDDIIPIDPVINLAKECGWRALTRDGTNLIQMSREFAMLRETADPTIIFYETVKGQGVSYMEKDPVGWHYRKLTEEYMV